MPQGKFLIIGGDLRNVYIHELLKKEGHRVKAYGFSTYADGQCPPVPGKPCSGCISRSLSLPRALANTDIVIGPTPCCSNGLLLNMPFHTKPLSVSDLFGAMQPGQIFYAGRISPEVIALAAARDIEIHDILDREEMAILNAIPTAEGAIQLALEKMNITLHGANALVLGYGRVGKTLADRLKGMGAHVHVAARKPSDLATARGLGYKAIDCKKLPKILAQTDVVFNTVPSILLDETNLWLLPKHCILLELASRPFGIDPEAAKKEGLALTFAPSLPGKVAPVTAARYILETIDNIQKEKGGSA